jgi:hypothetical protein
VLENKILRLVLRCQKDDSSAGLGHYLKTKIAICIEWRDKIDGKKIGEETSWKMLLGRSRRR